MIRQLRGRRFHRRRESRLLIALVTSISTGAASAAPGQASSPPIHVDLETCDASAAESIRAILQIELGAALGDTSARRRLAITCKQDAAILGVSGPAGEMVSSTLDLSAVPAKLRARVIALASAELARTLPNDPPLALAPAGETARPVPEAPSPETRLALAPFLHTMNFDFQPAALVGGGVRWQGERGRGFAAVQAAGAFGVREADSGKLETTILYVEPQVGTVLGRGSLQTRLAAGYALGMGNIRGEATSSSRMGASVRGMFGGPLAVGALAWLLTTRVHLALCGEIGWVVHALRGEVARAADVRLGGSWLTVQAGIEVQM